MVGKVPSLLVLFTLGGLFTNGNAALRSHEWLEPWNLLKSHSSGHETDKDGIPK